MDWDRGGATASVSHSTWLKPGLEGHWPAEVEGSKSINSKAPELLLFQAHLPLWYFQATLLTPALSWGVKASRPASFPA